MIRIPQDVYNKVCQLQEAYEQVEERLVYPEHKELIKALEKVKKWLQKLPNWEDKDD